MGEQAAELGLCHQQWLIDHTYAMPAAASEKYEATKTRLVCE